MVKRVIAAVLAATMILGLCGCGEKEPKVKLDVKAGTPTYEDDRQIEMAAYSGPNVGGCRYFNGVYGAHPDDIDGGWDGWITEEAFKDYMDCGFTFLFAGGDGRYDYDHKAQKLVSTFDESDLYPYMELAEKMGIPVVVSGKELSNITASPDYRLTEDQKAHLAQMVADLSEYKMFKGFTFKDEPNIEAAKTFAAVQDYLDSLKSDLFYYTSMFPMYVPDLAKISVENQDDRVEAYKEYVDAFSDAIGWFAYDSYPLFVDPTRNTTYLHEMWFQNLRLVAESAKEKDYDASITIQSCTWGAPGGELTTKHNREITTKADITFQLYTSMSYGFKNFMYFTYWQHKVNSDAEMFYSAMVNFPTDGTQNAVKSDAYYAVKAANEEIKKFDHVYLNFDWEGTFALTGEGKTMSNGLKQAGAYESPRIKEATATDETVIGCFKDQEGYDGYMIANATDPGQNLSTSVTVTFREASKAIAYVNGEEQTITLENGTYTFDLESGAGVFVIPIQ